MFFFVEIVPLCRQEEPLHKQLQHTKPITVAELFALPRGRLSSSCPETSSKMTTAGSCRHLPACMLSGPEPLHPPLPAPRPRPAQRSRTTTHANHPASCFSQSGKPHQSRDRTGPTPQGGAQTRSLKKTGKATRPNQKTTHLTHYPSVGVRCPWVYTRPSSSSGLEGRSTSDYGRARLLPTR